MDNEHPDEPTNPDDLKDQPQEDLDLELEGYALQREITRGGQAIIFSAIQKSTGRKVAVKFFPGGTYATKKEKVRMDREVRVLAALDHPNIVSVIDRGQTPDGSTYFVLEYVHGKTLAEFIDDYWEKHGPPESADDMKELLQMFVRIADAINAAHLRGVVHRDLKPSNIIIDGYGEPHILDFGVALSSIPLVDDEGESLPSVTWTGEFLGSVQWASPEQAEGDPTKVDVRSDVYSLGVILYEMLTGEFPYEVFGNIPDVLNNILQVKPKPPSEVLAEREAARPADERKTRKGVRAIDPVLDSIVLKALEKKREDRFQTAGEFAKAVSSYLSGKTISLKLPFPRKRILVPAAGGVAAALVLAGGVFLATKWHLTRSASETPAPDASVAPVVDIPALNLFGYHIEDDQVVFEFDPRDYDVARMEDASLGSVTHVPVFQTVSIAGPFNDWKPEHPDWTMKRMVRNRFELRQSLDLFKGRYEWPFKFVVNGRIWVSAPRQADNKEVVIEDTATYNLILINPREEQDTAARMLRVYRERINQVWPGQGENLAVDTNGLFHLTLTHLAGGARVRSLDVLADIPLASLNLGEIRIPNLSLLEEYKHLKWFVIGEAAYASVFYGMISALTQEEYAKAREEIEKIFEPVRAVPAMRDARQLFLESIDGMVALREDPRRIPEQARLFGDSRYLLVPTPMNWYEARRFADRHGAHLATITSAEEQEWITGNFGWPTLGRTIWLGGTDEYSEGNWIWITREPWTYGNWMPGQPDNLGGVEHALAMKNDGWWMDMSGDTQKQPFLIEWSR